MINKLFSSLAGQFFIVLLGLAIVSACSMRPSPQTPGATGLTDTHWQLKKLAAVDQTIDEKRQPTMSFTADRMSGFNGCNRMFANYATGSDGSISFGHIGATRMACIGRAGQVEMAVSEALQKARLYAVSRNELALLDKGRKVLMILVPQTP